MWTSDPRMNKELSHRALAKDEKKKKKPPTDGRHTRLFADNARQLWLIIALACGSLAVIYGLGIIILELVVKDRNPNWNREKEFEELDASYQDIAEDVIPFVQQWYRSLRLGKGPGKEYLVPTVFEKTAQDGGADVSCLEAWFDDMKEHLDGSTSPPYMEMILDNMGLRHSVPIRTILEDYLQDPQPLASLYNESLACLENIHGVAKLACDLRKDGPVWDLGGNEKNRIYATYAVNVAVIVEVLTRELQSNLPALHEVIDIMNNEGYRRYEDTIEGYNFDRAALEFRLQKYRGVALTLKLLGQEMASGKTRYGVGGASLAMNILEAVKLDVEEGHEKNARVGLALATGVRYDKNDDLDWKLGKKWIDAYMVWNMAFVMGQSPLRFLGKLLVPSVACEADVKDDGKDWAVARTISLALALIGYPGDLVFDAVNLPEGSIQDVVEADRYTSNSDEFLAWRWPVARSLGQINFVTAEVTPPSANSVEQMLFTLCGGFCYDAPMDASDSAPHARMNVEQFHIYTAIVTWITVLLAGLGTELFLWYHFLQVWDDSREGLWKFAQFLFPLMSMISLGLAFHQDFWSLAFLVAGLWKFGFPETLMYLYLGMFARVAYPTQRISDLLNGIGTLAHHSSASLLICSLVGGAVPPSSHIANPIFILMMQHWFCLLAYVNHWLYTLVELFLELWFEWLVISEFWYLYQIHWVVALSASVMLFAHWLYLSAAGLALFSSSEDEQGERGHDNVYTRGAKETTTHRRKSSFLHRSILSHRRRSSGFVSSMSKSGVSWQLAAAFFEERHAVMEEAEEAAEEGSATGANPGPEEQVEFLSSLDMVEEKEEGSDSAKSNPPAGADD